MNIKNALVLSILLSFLVTTTTNAQYSYGKSLTYDRKKGNCIACHFIQGGDLPGNIGPPLIAMKARYSDKAKLREQIYDARTNNIDTIMPPFGSHKILSDEEIDAITEYIYTL